MMLTAADWAIIAVVALSALVSVFRGFIKEAISLLAWVAAFVVTGNFYDTLADRYTYFEDSLTRTTLAVLSLFVVTLLVVGLFGRALDMLIKKAGLSGTDRLLGVVFGIIRGLLIVCAALALFQILFKLHILTFLQDEAVWRDSVFIPELMRVVSWFFVYLGTDAPVGLPGVQ